MTNDRPVGTIILFGAGRMGLALLRGWLNFGVPGSAIAVVEPQPSELLLSLSSRHGFAVNRPVVKTAGQTIVIAVKPQRVEAVCEPVSKLATPETLLVSVMAGKTVADLEKLFPNAGAYVRAMPNLPAAVGRGMTLGVAGATCTLDQRTKAEQLLACTGMFQWLESEAQMDPATGVSGSGPAYVFYLAECLTRAGAEAGLPPLLAERLARATIAGAGAMLADEGASATELRRDVTSPGGTTEAGLAVWMADGLVESLAIRTVRSAAARAAELSGAS